MKQFYVHIIPEQYENPKYRKYNGATLSFVEKDQSEVFAYVTFCSKKDRFSRKVGRQMVEQTTPVVIHKRNIAKFTSEQYAKVYDGDITLANENSFMYLLKNVV